MARWCCSLSGLLAVAALCAGCAANRPGNPFGIASSKSPKSSGTAASKRDPAAKDQRLAQGPAKAKGPGSSINDIPKAPASGDPKSPGHSAGTDHDPETMAYIEKELRDATPEERASYLADFKGMHPGSIRQVLRGRRMAFNHEWASRDRVDPQTGETVQTAGAEFKSAAAPTAGNGVQNAAGYRDSSAAPGNRATHALATVGAASSAQPDHRAGGNVPSVPVGHNTGYRLGQNDSSPVQNRAAAAQAPVVGGRPNPVTGAPDGPASGVTQTAGQNGGPGAAARSAQVKPAVVTIGAPTIAGDTPVTPTGGNAGDATSPAQLARLISIVEAEAFAAQPGETEAQKQGYIKKQVDLRMLYLMSGQQERALQAIPGLDPADQEFWQQTFWGLTNYFDSVSIPSASERAAQTVLQMQNAVLRLQEKANLELRNVSFCHKISSFGNYEKYQREEFSPGQEVLLYAEVANIHSEPIPDGKFRTSLKSTLEIVRHGPQGEVAERIDLPETVDICRTHRRDYFHSYQFTIPAKLSLGPQVLKLTVEDQLSHRVTTYALNFMVK